MSTPTSTTGPRTRLVLLLLLVVVAVLCIVCAEKYTTLKLHVVFADGQVAIFKEMEASAYSTTDPREMTARLEYVVNYYPSGSKQMKGTRLDRIVEAVRSNSIAAIIARLHSTTGKDLGPDPRRWLKEYPPPN